jgi:hypothetical protein
MSKPRINVRRIPRALIAIAALAVTAPALAQRFDGYDTSTQAGLAGTFAGLTLMVTAWLTLADNGPWHRATTGRPWVRTLLVVGPPLFIGWLLS